MQLGAIRATQQQAMSVIWLRGGLARSARAFADCLAVGGTTFNRCRLRLSVRPYLATAHIRRYNIRTLTPLEVVCKAKSEECANFRRPEAEFQLFAIPKIR